MRLRDRYAIAVAALWPSLVLVASCTDSSASTLRELVGSGAYLV